MSRNLPERLNMLILSMVTKQKLFDDLESELFQVNIYKTYINHLIEINMDLLNLEEERKNDYKRLIELYIEGSIDEPDQVIEKLKDNLHLV